MLNSIMSPMLALVVWTFIMLLWLYALRIPAMRAAKIDASKIKGRETHEMFAQIPAKVHWPADNYNHLHEQPVIFYALCVYSHLVGVDDELNVGLAWGYVGIRVAHSLIQATTNYVPARFLMFATGSVVLGVIMVRNVLAAFS